MTAPAKILTIDDDQPVRDVIASFLEILGYQVIQAENGRTGIEMCRSEQPDLVLSDLRMPETDGLEVLATVRSEFPEMPIIVVTGMGSMTDVIKAIKLGAWDYITKPIQDIAVLRHSVEKALERAKLLRENREHRDHLEKVNKQLTKSLRTLQEDEVAARKMQFHLLPDDNQMQGGYNFQRALYPSLYLSGDFIDYFTIDADHCGFYIADVSGHGVSSALVTFLLRSYMHRYLGKYVRRRNSDILQPAATLKNLNHTLLKENLDKYLTIFYGVLNMKDNTLHYSNGGQFPHPILTHGGCSSFIESSGLPVGILEEATYDDHILQLPECFTMVMISDGILEILPQPTLKDKQDHLLKVLNTTEGNMESLIRQLELEKYDSPPDDIALLFISRKE